MDEVASYRFSDNVGVTGSLCRDNKMGLMLSYVLALASTLPAAF